MRFLNTILIAGMIASALSADQNPDQMLAELRIQKQLKTWIDYNATIVMDDGSIKTGRLIEAGKSSLVLENDPREWIAYNDIQSITIKPGKMEVVMGLGLSILGGTFAGGATMLISADSNTTQQALAGSLGAGVGLYFGYTIFMKEIHLSIE